LLKYEQNRNKLHLSRQAQ